MDEDEFGDLYADVLIPSLPSSSTVAAPVDARPQTKAANNDGDDDWMLGGAAPAVEAPANWDDDEDDENHGLVSISEEKMASLPKGSDETRVWGKDLKEGARVSGVGGGGGGENLGDLGQGLMIPGLASEKNVDFGSFAVGNGGKSKATCSEHWDSDDSEDDLQIVLNDTSRGQLGGLRSDGITAGEDDDDDEDGEEDLVIVTGDDVHHHLPAMGIEEQDWGEESMQPGAEGEGKELPDSAKSTGAAAGTRTGYPMHGFHSQHHAMYKYIRPGVIPPTGGGGTMTGAAGPPGAVRPLPFGSVPGRGRGDWRPAGGRGFNYVPPWANNPSARAFGTGLDFTLPSHKTIFEIDIESFEEKPWRYPGVDISDFFNFDLDEDKWKEYCKQLDQLRLESTMQSKIRVYESGRSEQEYDPDLPPELAAATGHHDIYVDNGHAKPENGQVDYSGQGKGTVVLRPPFPTGRAIQVETGSGERLPSIDTRLPRMRDCECIIEIVLEDCYDDPESGKNAPEGSESNLNGDVDKGFYEVKEERNAVNGDSNVSPGPYCSERTKRVPHALDGDDISLFPSESSPDCTVKSRTKSPKYSGGSSRANHQDRLASGSACRIGLDTPEHSSGGTGSQSTHSYRLDDQQNKVTEGMDVDQKSDKSLVSNDAADELSKEKQFTEEDDKLALVDSISIEAEDMASDYHLSDIAQADDTMVYPNKRQKFSSQVGSATLDAGDEDNLRTSSSDNSRSKSSNSRDYMRNTRHEEVVQEGRTSGTSDFRRSQGEEHSYWRKNDYVCDFRQEIDQRHMASKGSKEIMLQSLQHRDQDSLSSRAARGRNFERSKDIDASNAAWQRTDDSLMIRRIKNEKIWRENNSDMISRHRGKLKAGDRNQRYEEFYLRKHVEDADWRGHNKDEVSWIRERDNHSLSRYGNMDEVYGKGKRDVEYLRGVTNRDEMLHGHRDREDSGRRKRERDNVADHRREGSGDDVVDQCRRENIRSRDKAEDYYPDKHKGGSWRHREREDKQGVKLFENALTKRESERRGMIRSVRVLDKKTLSGSVRSKDGSLLDGSEKELDKDGKRPTELVRKVGTSKAEGLVQHKAPGNGSSCEKLVDIGDRSSRHESNIAYSMHTSNASDNQQINKEKHREQAKSKDIKVEEQKVQALVKRKHEEYGGRHNKKVSAKVLNEEISNAFVTMSKKDDVLMYEPPKQQLLLGKLGEADHVSDDEVKEASGRGRSKLERWTSHKEKDLGPLNNTQTLPASSKSKAKEIGSNNVDIMDGKELTTKVEVSDYIGNLGNKADAEQIGDKTAEDRDRHLDTVAKLKRRSERFKLPMPGEKDVPLNRKMENEVLSHNDASAAPTTDAEVKPERPARKRRWTGS